MTKKELSQLYYLNREIDLLQEQLEDLRRRPPGVTVRSCAGMPGGGISDKVGDYAAQIADLEQMIKLRIEMCALEYKRLNSYINSIQDSQMRQILSLRYVKGLSWLQVAQQIGGGNTAKGMEMTVKRYLEQN